MRFYTHIAFNVLLYLILREYFDVNTYLLFFIFLFFSLFPDIDEPKSFIGRKFGILSSLIKKIFRHRGLFHGIFIPLILFFIIGLVSNFQYGLIVFIAYLGHLIMDALTKEGVNFLEPLTTLRIKGFFRTGGILEKILFVCLITVISIYIF